jgi:hypothetical protein
MAKEREQRNWCWAAAKSAWNGFEMHVYSSSWNNATQESLTDELVLDSLVVIELQKSSPLFWLVRPVFRGFPNASFETFQSTVFLEPFPGKYVRVELDFVGEFQVVLLLLYKTSAVLR